jgi:hypothetical protein
LSTTAQCEHPCHTLQLPARHGDGTPSRAGVTRVLPPKRAQPTPHKMPLTNLCNRLVVNEHPWDPLIHERLARTSLTAPSIAAPCPARPCWGRNNETPGRRRVARRHPRPRVTRRWVPCAPAVTERCPSPRRPPPFSFGRRQLTRWRFLPLREPDSEVTDTSCRSTRHVRALALTVVRSQGPLHDDAPPPPLPDPKCLLPAGPEPAPLCWRRR